MSIDVFEHRSEEFGPEPTDFRISDNAGSLHRLLLRLAAVLIWGVALILIAFLSLDPAVLVVALLFTFACFILALVVLGVLVYAHRRRCVGCEPSTGDQPN